MTRGGRVGAALSFVAVLLAGCSENGDPGGSAPEAEADTVDPDFQGEWSGQVEGQGSEFLVELSLDARGNAVTGEIYLPQSPCAGSVESFEVTRNRAVLDLAFTPESNCIDGGVLTLTLHSDDALLYEWQSPDDDRVDSGLLERTPSGD